MGQIASVFGTHPKKLLLFGVEGSGSSTILYRLLNNEVLPCASTISINIETVTLKNGIKFEVWDLASRWANTPLRKHYYKNTSGIMYVVDSSKPETFGEAYALLSEALSHPDLYKIPLIVMANKQDIPNSVDCGEITQALHLENIIDRAWHILPVSAVTNDGLQEAFNMIEKLSSGLY